MVTDHAATAALDNFRFDLPEVQAHQFANCCRIACLVVHPSRHHAINRLLPLRVLDDRFHESDHGTGDLLVDSSFAVR